MRSLFVLLLCLGTATALVAQTELWSSEAGAALNRINWIEQANDGTIITAGHQTGETAWTLEEVGGADRNTFFNVEGMPLFYVETSPLSATAISRGFIVNAGTGEVLYDTREDKLRVKTYTFVPETSSLIFEAMKGGNERYIITHP